MPSSNLSVLVSLLVNCGNAGNYTVVFNNYSPLRGAGGGTYVAGDFVMDSRIEKAGLMLPRYIINELMLRRENDTDGDEDFDSLFRYILDSFKFSLLLPAHRVFYQLEAVYGDDFHERNAHIAKRIVTQVKAYICDERF